jgi:F0F1-type ATP synthase membrane subunit b/b'
VQVLERKIQIDGAVVPLFKASRASYILQLAQQTAEQAIADAHREADRIVDRAHEEAERIIAEARSRARVAEAADGR